MGEGGDQRERAFKVARRAFVKSGRLEMASLADELHVDRTTLFRWLGNRDQLITDIILSLAKPTIDNLAADAPGTGGGRVAWIAREYAQMLIEAPYYRLFLQSDPQRSLRLMSTNATPVQSYVVGRFERLLEREQDRGHLEHALSMHDLAYLIIRVIESFTYSDLIAGEEPDASKVGSAVAALLGVLEPSAK